MDVHRDRDRLDASLPSIRLLFPELWSVQPTTRRLPTSSAHSRRYAPSKAKAEVGEYLKTSLSTPPVLDASSGRSAPHLSCVEHHRSTTSKDAHNSSPSPSPSAAQLPEDDHLHAARQGSSSPNFPLSILRIHPVTADLENLASSFSLSSPPRLSYRSGRTPRRHEAMDPLHQGEMLSATTQPTFRVTIQSNPGDSISDSLPSGETESSRRHRCPHCGKGFNRPSSLVTHVNMHTGAKPYRCLLDGCPRRFNVKSNMRRHYQRHLRQRPSPSRSSSAPSALASSRSPSPQLRDISSWIDDSAATVSRL
ncbi:hypothetical protein BV20DRAFT_1056433 [Pilatotrama ljubarskyi]|nr:hypothetical protein BV20DRAFT_1056433 [Pilatotrama ljubarskyi]